MSAEQARELSNLEEKLRGTKSTSKRAKLERQREKLLESVRELQEEQEGEEEEEEVARMTQTRQWWRDEWRGATSRACRD